MSRKMFDQTQISPNGKHKSTRVIIEHADETIDLAVNHAFDVQNLTMRRNASDLWKKGVKVVGKYRRCIEKVFGEDVDLQDPKMYDYYIHNCLKYKRIEAHQMKFDEVRQLLLILMAKDKLKERLEIKNGFQIEATYNFNQPIQCLLIQSASLGQIFTVHYAKNSNSISEPPKAQHTQKKKKERRTLNINNETGCFHVILRSKINSSLRVLKQELRYKFNIIIQIPAKLMYLGYKHISVTEGRLVLMAGFQEYCRILSSIPSPTLKCLIYNNRKKQIIGGGKGRLVRWKTTEIKYGFPPRLINPKETHLNIDAFENILELTLNFDESIIYGITEVRFFSMSVIGEKCSQLQNLTGLDDYTLCKFLLCPEMDYYLTASVMGDIKVWSIKTNKPIHEYVGHYQRITGMVLHKEESYVLTSSTDRSLRAWSLLSFEQIFRHDMDGSILGLHSMDSNLICMELSRKIIIFQLFLITQLFSQLRCDIKNLEIYHSKHLPSRIIVGCQNGDGAILSPISGGQLIKTIGAQYTSPQRQLIYERKQDKLFSLMEDGNIFAYTTTVTPCLPTYIIRLSNVKQKITAMAVLLLDHAIGLEETFDCDYLLFVGDDLGRISLLDSMEVTMSLHCKAYDEPVNMLRILKSSTLDPENNRINDADRLVSISPSENIFIFRIQSMVTHFASIHSTIAYITKNSKMLKVIAICEGVPNQPYAKVFMSDPLTSHRKKIMNISAHTQFEIFASCAEDMKIKVWSRNNILMREITCDSQISCLTFLNNEGDLLIAYEKTLRIIRVETYVPKVTTTARAVREEKRKYIDIKTNVQLEDPLAIHDVRITQYNYTSLPIFRHRPLILTPSIRLSQWQRRLRSNLLTDTDFGDENNDDDSEDAIDESVHATKLADESQSSFTAHTADTILQLGKGKDLSKDEEN
ncbi:hypothetical protein SNEBB_005774 [Seison nebaliae]|nr:hypothetical protein SNEBB_005774 [Seison nebaliae]